MRTLKSLLLLLVVALIAGAGFVWSGMYDIAADTPHWPVTKKTLEILRDRSIAAHAGDVAAPNLDDPVLIRSGAGNYDSMCTGCHLKPGEDDSELHRGLYPQPPDLARQGIRDPARVFWVIKHGIKASAMPAWGKSMEDKYIWGMVAFLQRLPQLNAEQYHAEVAASGGHHHGGGEDHHEHGDAGEDHDHAAAASETEPAPISLEGLQPGAAPDAEAAVQAFQDALKRGDRAAALDLLAPQLHVSEAGATEDLDQYAAGHLAADMAFLKDAKIKRLSRASVLTDDTARVVSISEIRSTAKGKPVVLQSRESMQLERYREHWWITAIRWESESSDEHSR